MSPRDREVLEGSGDLGTSGEFRDWIWQRVARVERASRGDKKPNGGGSAQLNELDAGFGIVSKM